MDGMQKLKLAMNLGIWHAGSFIFFKEIKHMLEEQAKAWEVLMIV